MKALKIYSLISTIIIIILSVCLFDSNEEYKKAKREYMETNQVLQQCSDSYYEEICK